MTGNDTPNPADDVILNVKDEIFADKTLLSIGHVPESNRIVGRDKEITELAEHVRDAASGYSPRNVLVYGKTGVGKSLVSQHVSHRVKHLSDSDISVGVVYVDCAEDHTETQLISTVAEKLNDETQSEVYIPATGLSTGKYYKRLWTIINEIYDVVIAILDEVDMMDDVEALMKLSRAEESGKITSKIGVIAISNKLNYPERLDSRTKSSLQHKELFFSAYDAQQLREILRNRLDAFQDEIVSEDVVPLCAALAAQEHGDARQAIEMLRYAGELAHKQGDKQVQEKHIRDAQSLAEQERFKELIGGAPLHSKYALLALTELTKNNKQDWFRSSKIYDQYKKICQGIDSEPLSFRRFKDRLKQQALLEIMERENINKGRAGGQYIHNRLIENVDIVRESLLQDERVSEWENNN